MTRIPLANVAALVAATAAASAAQAPPVVSERGPAVAMSQLVGTVEVIPPERRGRSGSATSSSVVWLPGLRSGARNAGAVVTSENKRFTPRILAVPAGTEVAFPNQDPIYHNAFSLSPGNRFDLGLYRRGASKSVTLGAPGVVRVYCNIHPGMAAYVMVVDGDTYALTDRDGRYRITGIPPGRHVVRVWNEMAEEVEVTLDFEAGKITEWNPTVDGSRFRRRAHKNKYGRDYQASGDDADRY